jgi:tRNA (guanine37-N1)-methyltransferase
MSDARLTIDIITAFPAMFTGFLGESLMARGLAQRILDVRVHDLRDWSDDPVHHSIDDTPFGGGGGMILKAEPIARAVEALGGGPASHEVVTIIPTPHGALFDQDDADRLSKEKHIIFVCGHYTGMDERVFEYLRPVRRCVGDYVLSGGELPAMVMIEAIARRVPGFLGNEESACNDSFVRNDGGLGAPQYTRPAEWRGLTVPPVLLSGHHAQVADWRSGQAHEYTELYRPDLLTSGRRGQIEELIDAEHDVGGEG